MVSPKFFLEKRLDLKSLNGQTKAEELGIRGLKFLSLRLPLKALQVEPFLKKKLGENLLLRQVYLASQRQKCT